MAYLYRVRDAQGALLYIGITENLWGRFLEGHQHSARWWLDMADMTVTRYPDMKSARAAESDAIAAERPQWNIAGSPEGDRARLANLGPRPELGPDKFEERRAQFDRARILIRNAMT